MQIQHLEIFVNIYTTRSFARTAENMFMSQSAVSQALKSMENELGVNLFERTNHKVIPTERGSSFLSYAQNILSTYREGISLINDIKNKFYIHTQVLNHLSPINKALINLSYKHPDAEYRILQPIYRGNSMPTELMVPRHLYLVRKNWINEDVHFYSLGNPYYSVIFKESNPLYSMEKITIDNLEGKTLLSIRQSKGTGGPYLGELTARLEKMNVVFKRVESTNEMLSELIVSDNNTVAVISNKMALTNDIPVVSRKLYAPDEPDIGFAYIGEPTEYMLEFLELARNGLRLQDSESNF